MVRISATQRCWESSRACRGWGISDRSKSDNSPRRINGTSAPCDAYFSLREISRAYFRHQPSQRAGRPRCALRDKTPELITRGDKIRRLIMRETVTNLGPGRAPLPGIITGKSPTPSPAFYTQGGNSPRSRAVQVERISLRKRCPLPFLKQPCGISRC